MTKSAVVVAAVEWWISRRPLSMTQEQHMENPTINTTSDAEQDLAREVAEYLSE